MNVQDSEMLCRDAAMAVAEQMNEGRAAEIDPDTIRLWAELIFELLERCMALRRDANGVETAARNPAPFERLRVRAMVRRKLGPRKFRAQGPALVKGLFETAAMSAPGDVAQLADTIASEVGG